MNTGYANCWPLANQRINAPHSVVTALAHGGKRRAVRPARYRARWASRNSNGVRS